MSREGMVLAFAVWMGFGPPAVRAAAPGGIWRLPTAAQVAAFSVEPVPVTTPAVLMPPATPGSAPPVLAALATVVRSTKGKRFHKPGCPAARAPLAALGRAEAELAGLTPCQRCLGAGRARPARLPRPVETAAPPHRPAATALRRKDAAAARAGEAARQRAAGHGGPDAPAVGASPTPRADRPWDSPGTP